MDIGQKKVSSQWGFQWELPSRGEGWECSGQHEAHIQKLQGRDGTCVGTKGSLAQFTFTQPFTEINSMVNRVKMMDWCSWSLTKGQGRMESEIL